MNDNNAALPVWARIFLILFAYFFGGGIFQIITLGIIGMPLANLDLQDLTLDQKLVIQVLNVVVVFSIVFLFRKIADKKSILSLGFSIRNWFRNVIGGFLLSLSLIGLGSVLLIVTKEIKIVNTGFRFEVLAGYFFILIFVSLGEEVLLRGYILNNLLDSTNKYVALVISSIIFSSMHLLNAHVSFLAFLNLFLGGILLGIQYIYTRNLWFAISQHLFWNFIQGPIMGFNISGNDTNSGFLVQYKEGNIINGGDFGFEGSIICTFLSVLFIVVIVAYLSRSQPENNL